MQLATQLQTAVYVSQTNTRLLVQPEQLLLSTALKVLSANSLPEIAQPPTIFLWHFCAQNSVCKLIHERIIKTGLKGPVLTIMHKSTFSSLKLGYNQENTESSRGSTEQD